MDTIISLLRSIEDATGKLIKIDDNTLSKENTYSSSKIVSLLANAGFAVKIVSELPSEGDNNTIYFLAAEDSSEGNTYDEYMYIDQKFEKIGSTSIDLSDYVKLEDFNTTLQSKQDALTIGDGLSLSGSTLSVDRNLSASYTLSDSVGLYGSGQSFMYFNPGSKELSIGAGSMVNLNIGGYYTQNLNLRGGLVQLKGSNIYIGQSGTDKVNISGDTRITGMGIYLYAQTGSRYDQAISLTGGGIYMTGGVYISGSSNGYSSLSASGLYRISLDASYGSGGISLYGNGGGLNLYAGGSVYLTGKSIHLTGSGGSMNITSSGSISLKNINSLGLEIAPTGTLTLKGSSMYLTSSGFIDISALNGRIGIGNGYVSYSTSGSDTDVYIGGYSTLQCQSTVHLSGSIVQIYPTSEFKVSSPSVSLSATSGDITISGTGSGNIHITSNADFTVKSRIVDINSSSGTLTNIGGSYICLYDSSGTSITLNNGTFNIGSNYIWSTTGNLYLGGSRTVHLGSNINIANTQPSLTSEEGIESLLCVKADKVYRVTLAELKKALNNITE